MAEWFIAANLKFADSKESMSSNLILSAMREKSRLHDNNFMFLYDNHLAMGDYFFDMLKCQICKNKLLLFFIPVTLASLAKFSESTHFQPTE